MNLLVDRREYCAIWVQLQWFDYIQVPTGNAHQHDQPYDMKGHGKDKQYAGFTELLPHTMFQLLKQGLRKEFHSNILK